ncbi:MAG: hypothetical protein IJU02_05115 [Lachnospiraceae bacterium]|nr:hypothetical protein [Lachnospiraceae bacterium]
MGADNIGKVSEADAALMAGTWNLVTGEANGQKVVRLHCIGIIMDSQLR